MENIQYGNITGGDFSEDELYITMENDDFTIAFRKVAIVTIDSINKQLALEEFVKNLKNK
jgi:hypothetical protein